MAGLLLCTRCSTNVERRAVRILYARLNAMTEPLKYEKLEMPIGSTVEVRAGLQISVKLGFTTKDRIQPTISKIDELYFKLQKFKKYLRSS